MKTLEEARALAETMLELGQHASREVVCLLTDMDQPLGAAVGNALEIAEARDTVRGDGPPDFTELVLDACARLLGLSDLGIDVEEGRRRAEAAVADGSALAVYERWIRAQGGDPDPGVAAARARRASCYCAAHRLRDAAGRDRRRRRCAAPRRRPARQGRRDRSRGRRRLPREARRERRGGRSPGRGARPRRGERGGGGAGGARRVRARRRAASRARPILLDVVA